MIFHGLAAPFQIPLTHAKKSLILLDQIRTFDKIQLTKKLGMVSPKTLNTMLVTIQERFSEELFI